MARTELSSCSHRRYWTDAGEFLRMMITKREFIFSLRLG